MGRGLLILAVFTPIFCFLLVITTPKKNKQIPSPIPQQIIPQNKPAQPTQPNTRPGNQVNWVNFPPLKSLKDSSWGNFLTDIENHLDPSMGTQYRDSNKNTWAHETTHGINSYLNNKNGYYCLYVGYNQYAKINQPKITIKDVANLIPNSLRKTRYNTYLVKQQKDWNKDPIYLWDEWVAYTNGLECGYELINKKLYNPTKNDEAWAVLEFSVYATYVAITQEKLDPNYDKKQMLEFLAFNLERGMELYLASQKIDVLNWDNNEYLKYLRTHSEAAEFRNFLIKTYGTTWTEQVFGFK